jgi:hypothetical protein
MTDLDQEKDFFSEKQKENLEFFNENFEKYLADPLLRLKQVVIWNKKIVGVYDTFSSALTYAVGNLPSGEYVIQEIINEKEISSFLSPALA